MPYRSAPKLIVLDPCDGPGAQVEHDFVMSLERLAELREVEHDDASCHGNRPFLHPCFPRWPPSGIPDNALAVRRTDPSCGHTSAIALMLGRFV